MAIKSKDKIFDRVHKKGVDKLFNIHNSRKVKVFTDTSSFTVYGLLSDEKNQQEKIKNNTTEEITFVVKIKEDDLRKVKDNETNSKNCIFSKITAIEVDGIKYSQTFDNKNNHTKELLTFKLFKAKGS